MKSETSVAKPLFTMVSRKILLTLITQVLLGLIGIVSWYFVANYLPLNIVGIIGFAFGFCGLTSFLMDMGFSSAHMKKISEGKDIGECIGTYIVIRIVLLIVFLLSVISVIFFWKFIMGRGFESPAHEYTIYLMLFYFISLSLAAIGTNTYSAKVQTARTQIVILVAASIQLIATILVVVLTDNVYLYAATFIVNSVVNLIISFFFLFRFRISKPSRSLAIEYFKFAIPIMVISALGTLPINIDKVMIQLFWDSNQVAIYIGGQKFSIFLYQFAIGMGMILFPLFSNYESKSKSKKAKELIKFSERLISLFMAPACALVFVLSFPIVTILGDIQYADSFLVLQPLAVWAFMSTLNMPYATYIKGSGKMKVLIFISSISLILIVFFNLIFIPTDINFLGLKMLGLGPSGAAYATLIASIITFIMFRIFTFRKLGNLFNISVVHIIASSIIMAEIIFMIQYFFPAERVYVLAVYGMLGGFIYLGILFISGGITRTDRLLFGNVFNPKKMLKYIHSELKLKDKDHEKGDEEK